MRALFLLRRRQIKIVEMDELDTQGFADKRKKHRKIFFQ